MSFYWFPAVLLGIVLAMGAWDFSRARRRQRESERHERAKAAMDYDFRFDMQSRVLPFSITRVEFPGEEPYAEVRFFCETTNPSVFATFSALDEDTFKPTN